MRLFNRKQGSVKKADKRNEDNYPYLEKSALRQNNITRLTIDERWTKLFASLPMSPAIEKMQNEMNELIKKEAMLRQEQESLEPNKRKLMQTIMDLTKDAFEENDDQAKSELKRCKKEIERINDRMEKIQEEIERNNDELREANLRLLIETVQYVFSTLKNNKERAEAITRELESIKERENALREELDSINLDWTSFAVYFTELLGSDHVKRLESQFGLEGLIKNETGNSRADAQN